MSLHGTQEGINSPNKLKKGESIIIMQGNFCKFWVLFLVDIRYSDTRKGILLKILILKGSVSTSLLGGESVSSERGGTRALIQLLSLL